MIFRVFVKRTCPFSGIKSTPTSSFASRIAPCKLSSPFTTEPPTHSHIKGYVGLFAERCEIRYSPLELRIQTCTTRWYPSIGNCSPLIWSFPRSSLFSLYKSHISASGTYSTISPKSACKVLQILLRIVRLTSSSRRSFVIVLGAISAFLRKSDLLISLSTNNFHNRLYDTAIIVSPILFPISVTQPTYPTSR